MLRIYCKKLLLNYTTKKIIKDPQDIDYMSGENVKPMDVMRALK